MVRAFLLVLLASLAGCSSTYKSPGVAEIPVQEVAILKHQDRLKEGVLIEAVDGKWRGMGAISEYQLIPGIHSITVKLNLIMITSAPEVLWFDAKPRGRYILKSHIVRGEKMDWHFWIEEQDSGKVVSQRLPI